MKISRRHVKALEFLDSHEGYRSQYDIPNGNGHMDGITSASGKTMRELNRIGFVEYGKSTTSGIYGYRITDAGRRAVKAERSE